MSHRRSLLFKQNSGSLIPTENIIQYNKFNNDLVATIGVDGSGTNVNYDTGKVGDAVDLTTGSPSLVNFGDDDIFSFTDGAGNDLPFSMSFWIYVSGYPSSFENILSKYNGSSTKEYDFQITSGLGFFFRLWNTGSGTNIIRIIGDSDSITAGWSNIVLTYDGSESGDGMNVYINKIATGSSSPAGTYTGMSNTSASFRLGVLQTSSFNFRGLIDEFAIFDKELNQEEVDAIFDAGNSGIPLI